MPRDRFEDFESGGFTADYAGTCIGARFGINSTYGPHTLRAFITTRFDEPQTTSGGIVITERTEEFNVGPTKDWVAAEDGSSFEHVTGDDNKWINNKSDYAMLLRRSAELGARPTLEEQGDPTEAKMWVGTRWHWVTEDVPYTVTDRDTRKKIEGTKQMQYPVEFLGTGDAPLGQTGIDLETLPLSSGTLDVLTLAAMNATGPGDFADKALTIAMDLDSQDERDTVVDTLGNPAFFQALMAQ